MDEDRLLYRAIIEVPFTLDFNKHPDLEKLDTEDGEVRILFSENDGIVPMRGSIGVSRDIVEDKITELTSLSYKEGQDVLRYFYNNNTCMDDDYFIIGYKELFACTTIKDVEGNYIFEGDSIKVPDDYSEFGVFAGLTYEVFFNAGGFRLKPHEYKYDPKLKRAPRGFYLEEDNIFRIVGTYRNQTAGILWDKIQT